VHEIDLTNQPRIVALTEVMREVSRITEPAEMVRAFGPWVSTRFRRDYFISVSRRGLGAGRYKITRAIAGRPTFERMDLMPKFDPWSSWDELPVHEGGLIGAILDEGRPRLLADLDLTRDAVLSGVMGDSAGAMRSLAAMPAYDNGEALNWSISFSADEDWYSPEEFEAGMLDINMMGTATRNLVARKQVEELNARLAQQLEQIARIQRALLPERNPSVPGFEIATSYITSNEAGGDYYDFYHYPDGRMGVLIADVSGHGAGAATVMAMLRAIIHCFEGDAESPAQFADYCNEKLMRSNLNGNFITAFFCVIDPATGGFTWSRAGHNPPRVRRSDGRVEVLESAGTLPLGIIEPLGAEHDSGELGVGDTLVLYTDGITELRNRGQELFGEARLDAALERCSGQPECVVDTVHKAMFEFTGSMTRQDDQTLVVVRRTGQGR